MNWDSNDYLSLSGTFTSGSNITAQNSAGQGGDTFFAYEVNITTPSGVVNTNFTLSDSQANPTTIFSESVAPSATVVFRGVYFGARNANSTITLSTDNSLSVSYSLKVMGIG